MPQDTKDPKARLLAAALPHVPFDGWSAATFRAAQREAGVDATVARAVCPRGAVDLAVAYHLQGDQEMLTRLGTEDLNGMRFRDRIARAVQLRLQLVTNKEVVRKGTSLFSLPLYAADGARLVWGTCDAIWVALGDSSDDFNWYTKRATLSGVYSATTLFWLGDTSENHRATWAFLDRRIDDVMQIEKIKAQVRNSPTLSRLFAGPGWLLGQIRAPSKFPRGDLPGSSPGPRR